MKFNSSPFVFQNNHSKPAINAGFFSGMPDDGFSDEI
jgi:hypothetical protein